MNVKVQLININFIQLGQLDSVSVFGEVEPIPEYDKGDTEKENQLTFYIYTKYNVLYNKYKVIGTCQYLYDIRKKKLDIVIHMLTLALNAF